jgi:hypothetical protein
VVVLLALDAAVELRWAVLPLAPAAALLGVAGSHRTPARAGLLRTDRVGASVVLATGAGLLGGGLLLGGEEWWVPGAVALLVVPAVSFSVLDGASPPLWVRRGIYGGLGLLPGYVAATAARVASPADA